MSGSVAKSADVTATSLDSGLSTSFQRLSADVNNAEHAGSRHGVPEMLDEPSDDNILPSPSPRMTFSDRLRQKRHTWFAYLKTREFWLVLLLG